MFKKFRFVIHDLCFMIRRHQEPDLAPDDAVETRHFWDFCVTEPPKNTNAQ